MDFKIKESKLKKILIVDECDDIRFLISLKLKRFGYNVLVAKDGNDAFEILNHTSKIALIIIDLSLLNYSGLEFLENLNHRYFNEGAKNHINTICITSLKEKSTLNRALEIGIDSGIQRPITEKVLIEEVGKYMDQVPNDEDEFQTLSSQRQFKFAN